MSIENNKGDFDFTALFGVEKPPEEKPVNKDPDEDETVEFPWGKNWLSVHNPFLWRSI